MVWHTMMCMLIWSSKRPHIQHQNTQHVYFNYGHWRWYNGKRGFETRIDKIVIKSFQINTKSCGRASPWHKWWSSKNWFISLEKSYAGSCTNTSSLQCANTKSSWVYIVKTNLIMQFRFVSRLVSMICKRKKSFQNFSRVCQVNNIAF